MTSSSPTREELNTKLTSPGPTTVTLPPVPTSCDTSSSVITTLTTFSTTTTSVTTSSNASSNTSANSPGLGTEAVSPGSGPTDGLWNLTLDKDPPAGVNLVLFLPVCTSQSDSLSLPPTVSSTLQGSAAQVLPQHLEVGAAFGVPIVDFLSGIKQDPECDVPLDLSKTSNSSKPAARSIPLQSIKSEAADVEMSGETSVTKGLDCQDSQVTVKLNSGETEM